MEFTHDNRKLSCQRFFEIARSFLCQNNELLEGIIDDAFIISVEPNSKDETKLSHFKIMCAKVEW